MVWIMFTPILLAITILLKKKFKWNRIDINGNPSFYGLMIVATICSFLLSCILLALISSFVANYKTDLVRLNADLKVAQENYIEVEEIVTMVAEKYPLEGEILTKIKSKLMLKLPEIKSGGFLDTLSRELIVRQDKIADYKKTINETRRKLEWHRRYWLLSPNLCPTQEISY